MGTACADDGKSRHDNGTDSTGAAGGDSGRESGGDSDRDSGGDSGGDTDSPPEGDGFYLHPNGVTILCPDAELGATGIVGSQTYTKVDRMGLLALDHGAPEWTRVCTCGIVDPSFLFVGAASFNQDISTPSGGPRAERPRDLSTRSVAGGSTTVRSAIASPLTLPP